MGLGKSLWYFSDWLLTWNGCGFYWESTVSATFCTSPAPHLSRIAHIFGDLSSGNRMTWVSEFGSEISILLWKRTAKIFCLGRALVDFGECQKKLVGVKSYKISPPLLRVMSLKMTTWKIIMSYYRRVEYFYLFDVPWAKWRNKCLPRGKFKSAWNSKIVRLQHRNQY